MIALLIALFVLAAALEYWSLNRGFGGIRFDYRPETHMAEAGARIPVTITVNNLRRLPVSYLRMEVLLPGEAESLTPSAVFRPATGGMACYATTAFLPSRRQMTREIALSLPRRGRYFFRGATLKGGDFLGLGTQTAKLDSYHEVVVPPEAARSPDLDRILGGFLGQVSVRRFLFPDPVLTVGARPYTGQEPMGSISWPHSARTGELMVKQYDYTQEPTVTVLLDIDLCGQGGEDATGLQEACLSLTRSVCQTLEDRRVPYAFYTNADAAGWPGTWAIRGDGLGNLDRILEGLGRSTLLCTIPSARLLAQAEQRQETGRSTLLIAPALDAGRRTGIRQLEAKSGGAVLALTPEEVPDR